MERWEIGLIIYGIVFLVICVVTPLMLITYSDTFFAGSSSGYIPLDEYFVLYNKHYSLKLDTMFNTVIDNVPSPSKSTYDGNSSMNFKFVRADDLNNPDQSPVKYGDFVAIQTEGGMFKLNLDRVVVISNDHTEFIINQNSARISEFVIVDDPFILFNDSSQGFLIKSLCNSRSSCDNIALDVIASGTSDVSDKNYFRINLI